jgi:hypothetical protein
MNRIPFLLGEHKMPVTNMKVKSGKKYAVKYRVVGDLSSLTREQLEILAARQLRTSARTFCISKLNEAEPAIVQNQNMKQALLGSGMAQSEEQVAAFFASMGQPLEIPDTFEIPVSELIPDGDSGRGKKAADIFSFDSAEDADDDDDDVAE